MKEFNRSLAIIIGINQYQSNNIDSLATAKYDAEKLAEILNAQNRQDPYEVTLITDDTDLKPTGENILNILTKTLIKKDLKESDRLLFYFAGHGIARFNENDKEDEGPQGFLVPCDAEYNQPDSLIPMRKVYQSLAQLNCRHLLVILDCCFAGAFRWASTRRFFYTPKKTTKAHYHRFTKFRAWEVLTSSAHNQEALDFLDNRGKDKTEGKHSPFAQALFKGLKAEADLNSDGVIVAPELYLFIRDYVEINSQDRQTPGFFPLQKHDRGEYIFLIPNQELKLEPTPELNPDNNPYRGLNAYDEKHARFFFGRQELIQRLFMQVCRAKRRFTVVLGISGSGKSSLVKAGLIPQLRQEQDNLISAGILTESILEVVPYFPLKYLPINYNYQWQILETMRPGVTPFKELIRTFALLATNDISVKEVKDNPEKLINLINEWSKNNPKHKLLLVIDQFEELITQAPKVPSKEEEKKENWLVDKIKSIFKSGKQKETRSKSEEVQPEWQQLLEFLVNMIQNCPQLSIIVTLRSDFEPRFAESVLKPYWNRFIVRPMRPNELREVVEAPATEMALYFEPANLVDRLVDEVNQMPGALPLLSFTLSELYIKLYEEWKGGVKSDRSLTIDQAFEKQGGVAGSLTRRANEEYEQIAKLYFNSKRLLFRGLFDNISSNLLFINVFLFEHEIGNLYQVTMRRVMLRMVEIEGGEAVRRRVLKSELTYSNKEENKRVKTVLNCLVNARLIVTGKDVESEESYYEPAHDFLVRGWDKLQKWIDEEQKQGNLSLQRRLTPAAEEYFYKRGSLWNADPRLDLLTKILNSSDSWFNQDEKKFVQNSINRKRLIDLIIGSITIGAIIAAFFFNQLRINAQKQTARALTQSSQAFLANKQQIDTLVNAVGASRLVIEEKLEKTDIGSLAVAALRQAIYEFEINSLQSFFREHNRLIEHDNNITTVKFTPNNQITSDNQIIVSGSTDHTVKVWNTDGKLLDSFKHEHEVYSVAISPNNQLIVSGSGDSSGRVKVWKRNGESFDLLHNWKYKSTIFRVNFSPDGQNIAFVDIQGNIKIRNINGDLIESFRVKNAQEIIFSPDGQHIAIVKRNAIQILDRDYKPILDLEGQKVLVFSPDNQKIIALCSDKIIKIWNRYGKLLRTIPAHEESITSLSVSPDSQIIASGSVDRTVKLWDFDGQLLQTLEGHGDTILHVSFSSNGQKIASASNDRIIRIWKQVQNSNNNLVTILRKPSSWVPTGSTYGSVSFSPNGNKVAAINPNYNSIDIWDDKKKNLRLFPKERNKRIVSINFSPDSQGILWTNGDSIKFRDFNTRVTTTINQSDVNNINFAPNKDQFAAGSEDGTITTWHRDGRLIKTFMAHTEGITTITFSPDGKIIASGSYDDTIKLWTNDGKPLKTMIEHDSNVRDLAFSPDGKIIASASEDQTVRLWNRSGVLLKVLQGHQNAVWSVDFSPDGKTIASASIDGTIRLWSRSGKLLNTLKGHKGAIWDIRYSPNKNKQILVSYGSNKSVRLWNLDFYDLIEWSCDWLNDYLVTNSNVTEQELDYCPITK